MKKRLNLEWSLKNIKNTVKNKTCIILTETFKIVIHLPKTFIETQSFFIIWNQKHMIFVLRRSWSSEKKLLIFKMSSKTFTQNIKAISNYISSATPCDISSAIPLIPIYSHQEEPLGCKEFPEPNDWLKRYVSIVAYFGIMSEVSWHIPKCN